MRNLTTRPQGAGHIRSTAQHIIHLRQTHPQKRQIVAFASVSAALTNRKPDAKRPRGRSIQPTAPEPF